MEAIAGGYHGDAFGVLGPHPLGSDNGDGNQWEVRAFLPHAQSVELRMSGDAVPMVQKHPGGLFVAKTDRRPGMYTFHVTDDRGASVELQDAYRFQPLLSEFDLHLTSEGTNYEGYNSLGAHPITVDGVTGVRFVVRAPNAIVVSVVGNFNGWDARRHPMRLRTGGVWEIFIPGVAVGAHYKFAVKSRADTAR